MAANGSMDVPEISAEWYRDVVDAAAASPHPVQWFVGHATGGVILLLGALLLMAALSRRSGGPHDRALALIAPAPALLAFAGSEWFKTVVDEDRPCRTVGRAIIAGACPPRVTGRSPATTPPWPARWRSPRCCSPADSA